MTVAAAMLPEGDARTHAKLVIYADISKKHLASIEAIVKRARWRAARDGRDKATVADVDTAVNSPVTTPLSQMNPNAEVGAGSARGPRASLGSPPKLSSPILCPHCGDRNFAGRGFRRAAENGTPAACAPRIAGLRPVPISEFGMK